MKALFLLALLTIPLAGALLPTFASQWQGSGPFVGPEYWANPLYDWKREDGAVVATALQNRTLHLLTHRVDKLTNGFSMETDVTIHSTGPISMPDKVRAGFSFGHQGLMNDHRHVLVGTQKSIKAGVRADGRLFIGDVVSKDALPAPPKGALDDSGKPMPDVKMLATLRLIVTRQSVTLHGIASGKQVEVETTVAPEHLTGNLALAAESPRKKGDQRPPILARFTRWEVNESMASHRSNDDLAPVPDGTFGPILWSQYTYARGIVKLTAQFAPVTGDAQLLVQSGDSWKQVAQATIDPLSRTATFRWERANLPDTPYRVAYTWQDRDYHWDGTIRAEPIDKPQIRIGVFSCDHGYAFPLTRLVANVLAQDPDLVYFSGDQIYEVYGGFGVTRAPTGVAMLDYLRKYYQFGWTWRHVLKDRPSIIVPDDHDVFQGNLWGHGGRPLPAGKDITFGGYQMPPDWVNAVERTQTAHLPDSPDPAPVQQGIGVYFTRFDYAGIPFLVLEDRKFKTGPKSVFPDRGKLKAPADFDRPGIQLLGARQEQLLAAWAADTRDAPVRFVLSQTVFCKAATHTGPSLKPSRFDFDCNGWPRSGRDRALAPLTNNPNTIMLHGDQHLGILLRQGVREHGDGPLAFMVPGTANGFPRAWWPEGPDAPPSSWTGDFADFFGNKFTVLAAANPDPGSNSLDPRKADHPESTAHHKGSGHGIVTVDREKNSATFAMWRYDFDAGNPTAQDQFPGFPKSIPLAR